jgi:hypothetical protein
VVRVSRWLAPTCQSKTAGQRARSWANVPKHCKNVFLGHFGRYLRLQASMDCMAILGHLGRPLDQGCGSQNQVPEPPVILTFELPTPDPIHLILSQYNTMVNSQPFGVSQAPTHGLCLPNQVPKSISCLPFTRLRPKMQK